MTAAKAQVCSLVNKRSDLKWQTFMSWRWKSDSRKIVQKILFAQEQIIFKRETSLREEG